MALPNELDLTKDGISFISYTSNASPLQLGAITASRTNAVLSPQATAHDTEQGESCTHQPGLSVLRVYVITAHYLIISLL